MALTTRRRALTTLGAALAGSVALPAAPAAAGERKPRPAPVVARPRPQRLRAPAPPPRRPRPPLRQRRGRHLPRGRPTPRRPRPRGPRPGPHPRVPLPRPARRPRPGQPRLGVPGAPRPLQLLVDIKTEGASTYLELDRHLRRYRHLFTTYAHGRVLPGAVTAVISGDRAARTPMEAQTVRRAFYDGRLADLGRPPRPPSFIPLISDNWTLNFTWQGVGAFPDAERREAARHRPGGARPRAEGAVLGHPGPGRTRP